MFKLYELTGASGQPVGFKLVLEGPHNVLGKRMNDLNRSSRMTGTVGARANYALYDINDTLVSATS